MQQAQSSDELARVRESGIASVALEALRVCKTLGRYPVAEPALRKEVGQALRRAQGKAVPARDIAAALKGLLERRVILKDKARSTKGMPFLLALAEDRELIYQVLPSDVHAAVQGERRKLRYPAGLAALGTALKLTAGGKKFLQENIEKIAGMDDSGVALVWTGAGKRRKPVLVLAGEEGIARKLSASEVLRLRIEHADLLRTAASTPHRASMPAGVQAPGSDLRERIVAAYEELRRREHKRSVPILRLREALTGVERAALDRELVALASAEHFELSVHDHQHLLSETERHAQLVWPETGRTYYYLARIE